ncbi:MAG: SDR family oxidoreductase [Candidatus Omnitrophica bacterium]|nr:SDR family oxidoreductase [Candidatus Omnitrophota bacterium]
MMNDIFSVEKRIAIITGGMGQLGTQYAKTLLGHNAKVAVFDININKKNNYFVSQMNNRCLKLYRVDITKKSSIAQALIKTVKDLGKPSILINNAALDVAPALRSEASSAFEDYPERIWNKTLQVNLTGMFLACQVVGGYMAKNNGGSIINISSIYGNISPDQRIYKYRAKKGKPFFKPVSYAATKAGVINLSRYLATYWADKKVRVNTLSLGGVFNNQDKEFLKEYARRVPMARMAKEFEYNGAILFLASDASSYMTGSNIIIDGGFTAW